MPVSAEEIRSLHRNRPCTYSNFLLGFFESMDFHSIAEQ
jgi:hypothetical protein